MKVLIRLIPILILIMAVQHISAQKEDSFTVVYNNIPSNEKLKTDWGFAAWIEIDDKVILFDTGTKSKILQYNFGELGLDPTRINAVVISHEHYDHTGGLKSILEKSKKGIKVYLPDNFEKEWSEEFKGAKFIVNDKYKEVAKGVWITEVFVDHKRGIREQAIVLTTDDNAVVITGCAHPGIAEMCTSIKTQFPNKKFELVTGGFHLRLQGDDKVNQISNKLQELGFQKVAPSHCTGGNSISLFKENWGNKFIQLNLGDTYKL